MLQQAAAPARLAGVAAAQAYFAGCIDPLDDDATLWVAFLDEGTRCLRLTAYRLGAGASVLPARAILTDAARVGAAGLLLAHHQRGGDLRPSPAARAATRLLAAAAEACHLTLVDHLVFAGEDCTSMRRLGAL